MSDQEKAELYMYWLGWLTRETLIGWAYIFVIAHILDWIL